MIETTITIRKTEPLRFPPYNPKCRYCVIRNGEPCCGLFHGMWPCETNCPYAEYTPVRFPGKKRLSFGPAGC